MSISNFSPRALAVVRWHVYGSIRYKVRTTVARLLGRVFFDNHRFTVGQGVEDKAEAVGEPREAGCLKWQDLGPFRHEDFC
jgi:hypothetical protein